MLDAEYVSSAVVLAEPIAKRDHRFRSKWLTALKSTLPIYISVHIVLAMLTLFAPLFLLEDFKEKNLGLTVLWRLWYHWDTSHYVSIATQGYDGAWRTAFFFPVPLPRICGSIVDS